MVFPGRAILPSPFLRVLMFWGRGSVLSSVSGVNYYQTKEVGAQKRLICAPNVIFVQFVRRKGGFAHGIHSRSVIVSGFLATAQPEQNKVPVAYSL